MNYYTLLPNYCQGFNSPKVVSYCPQQQNMSSVLTILSQALKLSISQYSTLCIPCPAANEGNIKDDGKKMDLQCQQAIQKSESEEKVEIAYNLKSKEKENIEQNIVNLQVSGQKHNPNYSQTITNDQILSQNLLGQPLKENDDFSIINQKEKIRPKKHSFNVVVPQVSLIQTIDPPAFQIDNAELRKRRQSLLNRQVFQWNQKMKNRRGKREIRMLNN